MRLLTYNLKYLSGRNHPRAAVDIFHRRRIKKTLVDNIVAQLAPYDIVCLQEIEIASRKSKGVNQVQVLAKKGGFRHFTVGPNDQLLNYRRVSNVILSRHEIANHGNYPLNSRHFIHTKMGIPPLARGATYADIQFNGKTVRVITTHLGHTAYDKRVQLRRLSKFLDESPKNIILTGDFNTFPSSKALKRFVEKNRLRSAVPFDAGPSYNNWVRMRIDYIFYRGNLNCKEAGILPEKYSDHYPLMGSFAINNH